MFYLLHHTSAQVGEACLFQQLCSTGCALLCEIEIRAMAPWQWPMEFSAKKLNKKFSEFLPFTALVCTAPCSSSPRDPLWQLLMF